MEGLQARKEKEGKRVRPHISHSYQKIRVHASTGLPTTDNPVPGITPEYRGL